MDLSLVATAESDSLASRPLKCSTKVRQLANEASYPYSFILHTSIDQFPRLELMYRNTECRQPPKQKAKIE